MRNIYQITCVCETCISAMLFQSDLDKWELTELAKYDKLYINTVSASLLQIYKRYYVYLNNQILPNKLHIHIRASYAASSY